MAERLAIDGGKPIRTQKIPINLPYFDKNDEEAVVERLRSTWVSGDGPKCREFEQEFAKYLGVKHAFIVTSCTTALHLAFMIAELEGGEAIVPDFTYTSTALGPILDGTRVRLCDVDYETANINPGEIRKHINKNTRAIVPVDYAGHPCRIEEINAIADEHGLIVVQDAAQSCGAKFKGKRVGSQARITCFSFHSSKNLVTGEGGCLVTDDDELAEKARIMREKGTNKHLFISDQSKLGYYEYQMKGNSYVQTDILGALALSQLKKLEWMNAQRAKHAAYLTEGLKGIDGLMLPQISPDVEPNWSLYTVRVPEAHLMRIRDGLNGEGIGSNTHYHPLHISSYYKAEARNSDESFPNSDRVYRTLLRLPMFVQLTTEDLDHMIAGVKKVFANL